LTGRLHQLSRKELGRLFPIVISESQADWPGQFEDERQNILTILGSMAHRVEHIGSTAVPGLPAKPTIDVLVEIPDESGAADLIIERMETAGYIRMHEQLDHLMFVKGYTPQGLCEQSFHIHMATKDQGSMWERVQFRDYLLAHPEVASAYARLKYHLAAQYKYDREAYTEAKTEFIAQITELAKAEFRAE